VVVAESGPSMLSGLLFWIHIESVLGWSCNKDEMIGVKIAVHPCSVNGRAQPEKCIF
jgi:hypothetical protein